jgi:hypothetical protein
LAREFESGNDESHPPFLEFLHNYVASKNTTAEIGTQCKVNVEHHNKVCAGIESSDVPPQIELAFKRVKDEMDVHIF